MNIIECFTLVPIKYANFFSLLFLSQEVSKRLITGHSGPLDQTYKAMALPLKLMLNLTMAISE